MQSAAAAVSGERLVADLRALRQFGASGSGVARPSLSEPDVAARAWLAGRFADAGLEATIDGLGTVVGRSRHDGPAVVLGSHTDTQPLGGWLDGAYGVIAGLEVARALGTAPVDVVSWMDEEGAFRGFVGSRAFAGHDMADDLAEMEGPLRRAGWWGRPIWRVEPSRHRAYLEAHIEQGGRLEAAAARIGVVTAIVGIRQRTIVFRGRRNHAGTTPMSQRADAAAWMVRLLTEVDRAMEGARGSESVWTVGRMVVEPGAPSVIPDRAEATVQWRDADPDTLARMDAAFDAATGHCRTHAAASGVSIEVAASEYQVPPVAMDPSLVDIVAAAADDVVPGRWMRQPSGAAHDAQVVAEALPAAMLFVPSIGGVSHAADEDTAVDDLVVGCRVLARAVELLLGG